MNELYYQDAYMKEFRASVVSCTPLKQGYAVVLNQTAFYPEGGGQPGDHGTLNDIEVLDTRTKDGAIIHVTAKPIEPGTEVHGVIDWKRRFDLMQQHSGEHIFSGLVHRTFGYENIGFHLGEDTVTLDFSGPLSDADLLQIETAANENIWADAAVQITYPDGNELAALSYRSKKELSGIVRIVTFPDADVCACCGTHVRRAGEVGMIKVISSQNRKSGTRVDIVCGRRALSYIQTVHAQNTAISHLLSANIKETASAVERTLKELGSLRGEVHRASMAALQTAKDQIETGQTLAVIFIGEIDARDLRTLCSGISEEKQVSVCAVFSKQEDSFRYVIISPKIDLRPLGKQLNERFSGRGGGQASMVQGSLQADEAEIRAFLQQAVQISD